MKIIFLGAPGAGKGTQAEIVSERLGIPTISTGAIIRAAVQNGTAMGNKAKKFIEEGALVPDEVVIGIIKERLNESDCDKGYILDGFPRTVPQAEALDEMGVRIDVVLSIEVADEKIVERMSGRRVCPACGASYHVKYNPPANQGVCDKCCAELIIRSDDAADTVRNRLVTYHNQTEPLIEYYGKVEKYHEIDGIGTIEDVRDRIFSVMDKF